MEPSFLLVHVFLQLCQALAQEPSDTKARQGLLCPSTANEPCNFTGKKADLEPLSPGLRYELHLCWDQRRFRVKEGKIKLNTLQLVPHWVSFSKTESMLLLFSCLNNPLPGTPVKDAVMHCRRLCRLCHLLE